VLAAIAIIWPGPACPRRRCLPEEALPALW